MDILKRTENIYVEKIHAHVYDEKDHKFQGKFTFQSEESSNMRITLNVPDEEKVEYFEIEDPNGKMRIFSQFEDGMVYFKFSGALPTGIWTYQVKLYEDIVIPAYDIISVDVTLSKRK